MDGGSTQTWGYRKHHQVRAALGILSCIGPDGAASIGEAHYCPDREIYPWAYY